MHTDDVHAYICVEEFNTVGNREIGTGISEASKKVPIFLHNVRGDKQASSYFRQRNWGSDRLRSGSLLADLSLIV